MAKSNAPPNLPTSIEAEQCVLGSVLIDDTMWPQLAAQLRVNDFHLEKHQRIFRSMIRLAGRNSTIDDITLSEDLRTQGELASCDGVAYIASLTEGLPRLSSLKDYIAIVKQKALLRRLILVGEGVTARALEQIAPGEIISGAITALAQASDSIGLGLRSLRELVQGDVGRFVGDRRTEDAVDTGFVGITNKIGDLKKGELTLLAARPSMGKTALGMDIVARAAARGSIVAVFSLEMSQTALIQRMLCSLGRVNLFRMMNGYLEPEDRRALNVALGRMIDWPIYIDDQRTLSVPQMTAAAKQLQITRGLDLVMMDYLQLASPGDVSRNANENQIITLISNSLKHMAGTLNIPVLALSQLSRELEKRKSDDRRPKLSDLRGSGTLEQDADLIWFIHRPEMYDKDRSDLRGKAELIIAKNRNGPIGTVDLRFTKEYARFDDAVVGDEDEPGVQYEPVDTDDEVPF